MPHPLYVSSGAFIGRKNGFSPDGFFSVCREYDCGLMHFRKEARRRLPSIATR